MDVCADSVGYVIGVGDKVKKMGDIFFLRWVMLVIVSLCYA